MPKVDPTALHSSPLRAIWRTVLFWLWVAIMFLPVLFVWLLRLEKQRARLVRFFFKGICSICNIRVHCYGIPARERPLMLVTNHCSYVDIFVIGSQLEICFTPKSDVKAWPMIGFFCRLAACVFIERQRSRIKDSQELIRERLNNGQVICLFPEGTTDNGHDVLPFKSGLLSLAEPQGEWGGAMVQPAGIVYVHINGEPLTPQRLLNIAWVGEEAFLPHLFRFLGYKSIEAEMVLHAPLRFANHGSRKALCEHSREVIRRDVEQRLQEHGYHA